MGHPFFFSIEKERPWQRLSPASKLIQSEFFIYNICIYIYNIHQYIAPAEKGGPWRSLCRGSALCSLCRDLSGHSLRRARTLRVGTKRSLSRQRCLCRGPALSLSGSASGPVGPGALCRCLALWRRHQLRSACHPGHPPCRPPAPMVRGPPARTCHPSSPAPSLFPGQNPNLTIWFGGKGIVRFAFKYSNTSLAQLKSNRTCTTNANQIGPFQSR